MPLEDLRAIAWIWRHGTAQQQCSEGTACQTRALKHRSGRQDCCSRTGTPAANKLQTHSPQSAPYSTACWPAWQAAGHFSQRAQTAQGRVQAPCSTLHSSSAYWRPFQAPYFAARPAAAAALAEISLAVEALFAPMLQPSSSSRQAVEGAGSAAEAGSSAGGVLKALSAAHSFLARLAQAGCGPLLQACPHAAERLLGVSAAALRLAYRPLPTQASDTAHAASQVQTAAVAMLHASRGIACRVARHDLLASSDAGHGSAAGQAASERLHNILDRIAELSGVGADAAAQQLSLLPAAAAAHVCAIAMAAASVGRPQRKSNAAIVAGTASML